VVFLPFFLGLILAKNFLRFGLFGKPIFSYLRLIFEPILLFVLIALVILLSSGAYLVNK